MPKSKNKTKEHDFTVSLSPELFRAVELAANDIGRSKSDVVNVALNYIYMNAEKLLGVIHKNKKGKPI
jgi:hypothetical protein